MNEHFVYLMEDCAKVKFAIFRRAYFVFTSLKHQIPIFHRKLKAFLESIKSKVQAEYRDMNFVGYQREISCIFQYSPPLYFNTLI